MTVNRRIIRDFKKNIGQNIAYIFLVVLALGTIVSFSRSTDGYLDTINKFQQDYNLEDGSFKTFGKLTDEQKDYIEDLGVKFNEQVVYEYIDNDKEKLFRFYKADRDINKLFIKSGKKISNKDEIIIDCKYAEKNNVKLNDKLELDGETYKVVGFGASPDYCLPKKEVNDMRITPETFGVVYVDNSVFNDREGYVYDYQFKLDGADIDKFKTYLNDNVELLTWIPKEDNSRITSIIDDLNSPKLMSSAEAYLCFLVVAFMIANMVSNVIHKDVQVIGILYSQGIKRRVFYQHYLITPLLQTFIGSVISYILGIILSPVLLEMSPDYITPTVHFAEKPYLLFCCFVLPIIVVTFFVVLTLHNTLKATPLQLLHNEQNAVKISFIERHLKLSKLSFKTRFKMKNVFRNFRNNIYLLVGAMLSCLILNTGFYMVDGVSIFIDKAEESMPFEYAYMLRQPDKFEMGDRAEDAKTEEGCIKTIYLHLEGEEKINSSIFGIQDDSSFFKFSKNKLKDLKEDEVVISSCLEKKYNVKINDKLTIHNPLNDKKYDVVVKDVVPYISSQSIFTSYDNYNSIFDMEDDYYNTIFSDSAMKFTNEELASTISRSGIRPAFTPVLIMLIIMAGILLVIAVFILITVIYLLLSIIIDKSRVNISMTKIFGYNQKEVDYIYIKGKYIYLIIGDIISIPFAGIIVNALYHMMFMERDCTVDADVVWWHLLCAFVVIIIGYVFSVKLLKKRINGISYVEALKNRE